MSAEANKVLYRGMIEAVNSQDAEAWRGAFAEDYVWHGANGFEVEGIEAMREGMEMYWSAMPDFHIDILELVAEGRFRRRARGLERHRRGRDDGFGGHGSPRSRPRARW